MPRSSLALIPFACLSLTLTACASTGGRGSSRSTDAKKVVSGSTERAGNVEQSEIGTTDTSRPEGVTVLEPAPEPASEHAAQRDDVDDESNEPVAMTEQPPPVEEDEGPYGSVPSMHFDAVRFPYDSARLDRTAHKALRGLADHLLESSTLQVTVEGHCDEQGTDEYNLALGHLRATAIKSQLVKLGVDESRIQTVSFGEERPASEGVSREALAQNRRGEFVLYGEGDATAMAE